MIYWLIYDVLQLGDKIALFSYITFRAAMGALTALLMAYFLYPPFISYLKRIGVGEAAKEDAPKAHLLKAGTPTMGGIMIVLTVVIPVLLWSRLDNTYITIAILFMVSFAIIGFFDDFIKLRYKKRREKWVETKQKEWITTHEDSDDSMILSTENHQRKMDSFISLISEFLQEDVKVEEVKIIDELKQELSDYLKDDIYQLYFKRNKKDTLIKLREIWKNKSKRFEDWDRFLIQKNLRKESFKDFQNDIVNFLDASFQFKFQEKKKLETLVDEWYRWISMPYAIQELENQKRKWISSFNAEEKKRRTVVKDVDGLRGSFRFVMEFIISGGLLFWMFLHTNYSTILQIPFLKNVQFDLGAGYIFFGMFVIAAFANSVNLTDGLDGLAIGPVMVTMVAISVLTYITGHAELAKYLNVAYVKDIGELTIFSATVAAAGIGFLWFNTYPAQIFMGDVGSLGLGASIGSLVIMSKTEVLSLIFGGIFVIEALSVILQVSVYKTRKIRIFRMAPIHHHFEKSGLHENKIIVRFWLISIILTLISIITLKIR